VFGSLIIGDEILSGKRQDKHFPKVITLLRARGLELGWSMVLPDDPEVITAVLTSTLARDDIVFCFGGIGATPDDHTRQCAAKAAGVELLLHPEAKPGNEYQVTVRNRSGADLLAVISVDGVNVVSGETAAQWQSGYVIDRGRSLSIKGWRKSLEKVAAFYFTDLGDSYAALTGRPDNVGVIGVAVFKRKPEPVAELDEPRSRADAAGSAAEHSTRSAPQAAQKSIGTGHGRVQASAARYVEFERDSNSPSELIAIHYDTYANLVARGVIRDARRWPSPFPGGFVADPPGRG